MRDVCLYIVLAFHFLCVVMITTTLPSLLPQILGDVDHPLLVIMRECLSNVVDRRPTAVAILERINLQLSGEVEDDLVEKDKLQMIEELQRLQTECEELQVRGRVSHVVCATHDMYVCMYLFPR